MTGPTFIQPDTYQRNPLPGDLKIYTFEVEVKGAKHLFEWDGPARQLRDVTEDVPTDAVVADVRYPGQGQMYYIADDGSVMQDRIVPGTIKQGDYEFSDLIYASNGMIYGNVKVLETGDVFDLEQRDTAPAAELHIFYPNGDHAEPVIRYDVIELSNHHSKGQDQEVTRYPSRTEIKPLSVRDINSFTTQSPANAAASGAK